MNQTIEQKVRRRCQNRCEYCHLPQAFSKLKFVIDHIVAKQHRGTDSFSNLALACGFCNRHKGPNLSGIDPQTQMHFPLFHPRKDSWNHHFRRKHSEIVGLTPVGRATVVVLAMNHAHQTAVRIALLDEGLIPIRE